jgi:hypothetical protein
MVELKGQRKVSSVHYVDVLETFPRTREGKRRVYCISGRVKNIYRIRKSYDTHSKVLES